MKKEEQCLLRACVCVEDQASPHDVLLCVCVLLVQDAYVFMSCPPTMFVKCNVQFQIILYFICIKHYTIRCRCRFLFHDRSRKSRRKTQLIHYKACVVYQDLIQKERERVQTAD